MWTLILLVLVIAVGIALIRAPTIEEIDND